MQVHTSKLIRHHLIHLQLLRILKQSLEIHRFPVFCGFTVALNHLLQPLFDALFSANSLSSRSSALLSRNAAASFFASSTAAAGGLCLLNSKSTGDAGRTLDLTLFALVSSPVPPSSSIQADTCQKGQGGRYSRRGALAATEGPSGPIGEIHQVRKVSRILGRPRGLCLELQRDHVCVVLYAGEAASVRRRSLLYRLAVCVDWAAVRITSR